MFLQHSPVRPFVAVLGSLIGACLAQAAPDSVSLIEEPFVESFKFVHDGGVADDTVRPAPEDAPFDGPVVEVAVTEAPAKNWLVRLQGRSETAINEGDKVVVEFYTKLLQSDDDSGQLFFFAQVGGSEFPFRLKTYPDSEWGSAYGTFTAPRTYAPGELLFNMNLGFKAQTLQVGGVKIDKFPSSANVKDLLSQKLVGEEIEFDFDGGFSSVRNRNYKGEVGGEIPGGMKDNTAWADADVHYSKFTENPYAGGGALRVEVGDIRKGFVQLLRPEVGLTQDASTQIEIATRSASGTQMVVGFRQGSAPYKRLWEATVESGPDWRKQRLMVPPVTNDPDADFYLGFREAGQVDIDELTIGFLSTEEQKAQLDGNLAPVTSFPLGLVPPVAPAHHDFRPENYRVDRSEAGPTGMPAIRLEPTEQFQGKGHYWLRFAKELPPGQYTLSVYAKGERPSQGLSLRIGPPSERHWEAPYAKNIKDLRRVGTLFGHLQPAGVGRRILRRDHRNQPHHLVGWNPAGKRHRHDGIPAQRADRDRSPGTAPSVWTGVRKPASCGPGGPLWPGRAGDAAPLQARRSRRQRDRPSGPGFGRRRLSARASVGQ